MIEKVRDTDSLLHRLEAGQPLEIGQQNDPDSSDIGATAAHFREFCPLQRSFRPFWSLSRRFRHNPLSLPSEILYNAPRFLRTLTITL